jgi:Insect cuticle protein
MFSILLSSSKNRQFRLEERDNDGNVRGHYGYMDRQGQMKIVKYVATRDGGFQIES